MTLLLSDIRQHCITHRILRGISNRLARLVLVPRLLPDIAETDCRRNHAVALLEFATLDSTVIL